MLQRPRWDPDLLFMVASLIVLLLCVGIVQLVGGPLSRRAWAGLATVVVLLLAAQAAILLTTRDRAVMTRPDPYAALTTYLHQQPGTELVLAFPTIEVVLGRPLPTAAWTSAAWWTGASVRAPHRAAWRRAGWEVAHVHMPAKVVTFRRSANALNAQRRDRAAGRSSPLIFGRYRRENDDR
jgi:hypothetical protein